jgi:hypothetical protein
VCLALRGKSSKTGGVATWLLRVYDIGMNTKIANVFKILKFFQQHTCSYLFCAYKDSWEYRHIVS